MMAWTELARAIMPSGDVLTLRGRGADFEIRFNILELMTSRNAVSEKALAQIVCDRIDCRDARILIGGLGMGYTLRSVLDRVGGDARITVAELVPEVIEWNRGPLSEAADRPLDDARATVHEGDVGDVMRANPRCFDAILMDVDNGPEAVLFPSNHCLYSTDGVALILSSLKPGGVFALWAADRSPNFERVLDTGGLRYERVEVDILGDDGGIEHIIYLVRAN
jgi:spermidine synthase